MTTPSPTPASHARVGVASQGDADAARLKQLLLAARGGDGRAGALLWEAVSPRLIPYARAILGSRDGHDAQDCLQAALLSLSKFSTARLTEVRDPFGFLVTSVRNAAIDMKRAQRNGIRRVRLVAARDGCDAMLDAPRTLPDAQEVLLDRLWTLDEDQREIIILRHVAGLSFDQMSLALDAPRSTIFSRYKAALGQLAGASKPSPSSATKPANESIVLNRTGPLPLVGSSVGGAPC
jgi:RNA polymerase sigma-70 factor (ECF subfamily)